MSLIVRFFSWLAQFFAREMPKEVEITVEPMPEPTEEPVEEEPVEEPEKPVEKTSREKLYDTAYACIGLDMAPTQNELGCAESLYYVMKKAGVPNLPKAAILSTAVMNEWLMRNMRVIPEKDALPGDIIMSPTGWPGSTLKNGHTGVLGKYSIMSNNSATWKWDYHWTLPEWKAYYQGKGGIKTLFYRWN